MNSREAVFDSQARTFDDRAGLPAEAPAEIARAVAGLSGLGSGEWLLEVGCGTGEIGIELAGRLEGEGRRYCGFDVSRGMLGVFRRRLVDGGRLGSGGTAAGGAQTPSGRPSGWVALRPPGPPEPKTPSVVEPLSYEVPPSSQIDSETEGAGTSGALGGPFGGRPGSRILQADGNALWPVKEGRVGAVFSSRALHLLELGHVEAELVRLLGTAGGVVLVGRVVRPGEAPGNQLRRQLQPLLRARGFEGRGGKKRIRFVFQRCCEHGAALIEPAAVCRWKVEHSLARSLASWRRRRGLAGLDLPAAVKGEILNDLESWALETFGPLERPYETEETYMIEGVRFPGR